MAAVSTALLAGTALLGAATSAYGLYEQGKAAKRQEEALGQQNAAYAQQAAASVQASQASQRAEAARKRQMELDAKRATRQQIREQIVARALSVSRAYGRGAGSSSAATGAQYQIAGQGASGIRDIDQNLGVGRQIFQANYDVLQAQIAGANAGSQANYAGMLVQQAQYGIDYGKTLFNLGGAIAASAPTVSRIGSGLFSPGNGATT